MRQDTMLCRQATLQGKGKATTGRCVHQLDAACGKWLWVVPQKGHAAFFDYEGRSIRELLQKGLFLSI